MNNKLTINRSFYVKTRRNGSKSMEEGKAPSSPEGRIPRITRLLALSHRCYALVRDGVILNQSELAHYGQISTTRMSQIMWLDNLAPDIQEQILDLPRTIQGRDAILEREVRPIAKTLDWGEQRKMWAGSSTSVTGIIVEQSDLIPKSTCAQPKPPRSLHAAAFHNLDAFAEQIQ